LSVGYYVIDLLIHPSLWNSIVFVGMLVVVGTIIYTNIKWSRPKKRRQRSQR